MVIDQKRNKMWVEKYRPEDIEEVVSQQNNISTISNFLRNNKLPNLLFFGPPGTGKTTTALIVSKMLNGESSKHLTLELNASDARGIDTVRKEIKSFAETAQIFSSGKKFIILDEADAMTSAAQFALRRVIEKYTANVRFCFVCNHVNKIIPAIRSRCTKFRFSFLEKRFIRDRLIMISGEERVKFTDDGIDTVIKVASGDMRNCINILQACHFGYGEVSKENVFRCTGVPTDVEIRNILDQLLNADFEFCSSHIRKYQRESGTSLSVLITHLSDLLSRVKLPDEALMHIFENLANLEYRLSKGCSEDVQRNFLVAIFVSMRAKLKQ